MMRTEHSPTGTTQQTIKGLNKVKDFCLLSDSSISELQILPPHSSQNRHFSNTRRFCIRRNLPHAVSTDTTMTGDKRHLSFQLLVHDEFLVDRSLDYGDEGEIATLNITDDPIAELLEGLLLSNETRPLSARVRSFAIAMLCERLNSLLSPAEASRTTRLQEWQISRIRNLLSGRLDDTFSVTNIAQLCRLSVCQFSRLFKATYGAPFHKFLLQERVNRTMRLLSDSEASLSEIALDCGFSDQSCFTRRFSKATGTPPGLWRKTAKRVTDAALSRAHNELLCAPGHA